MIGGPSKRGRRQLLKLRKKGVSRRALLEARGERRKGNWKKR